MKIRPVDMKQFSEPQTTHFIKWRSGELQPLFSKYRKQQRVQFDSERTPRGWWVPFQCHRC